MIEPFLFFENQFWCLISTLLNHIHFFFVAPYERFPAKKKVKILTSVHFYLFPIFFTFILFACPQIRLSSLVSALDFVVLGGRSLWFFILILRKKSLQMKLVKSFVSRAFTLWRKHLEGCILHWLGDVLKM